jgi:hypothetical protein
MLARLNEVPWEALGAADLPGALQGVAASDREAALAALDVVRAHVWRDGAIFAATPHAVPFLVELAGAGAVLVRPPLLQLLAFLYGAGADEPAWVESTRAAVRRPLADYLALLGDEDRDVRIAAACLVTVFRDREAEPDVRLGLTHRYHAEPDEIVRATLLGSLNVYLPTSALELYDLALENDKSLLVRREAAHSLAAVHKETTPILAQATLLEAIVNAPALDPLYAGVAWNRRGVVADSLWALTRLGPAGRGLLRFYVKLLGRLDPQGALDVAEVALLVAFEHPAASRARADLAPDQLAVLRRVAETDAIWGIELPRMLAHYGLPRDQATLRTFLDRS